MELHFMIFAILLLTLIASCAIRQAEEEMIEQNDLDRRARKPPVAQSIANRRMRPSKAAT